MDSDHGICRSVARIGGGIIDGPIRSAVVRNQLVRIILRLRPHRAALRSSAMFCSTRAVSLAL